MVVVVLRLFFELAFNLDEELVKVADSFDDLLAFLSVLFVDEGCPADILVRV